jgi:hypothetical protein
MSLRSDGLLNTTAVKLKGRGLNLRHLSIEERVSLAVDACTGKLDVCNFSVAQSATFFSAPPSYVAAGLKAYKAATNGTVLMEPAETITEQDIDAAVDAFAAVFTRVNPQTQQEIVRKLAQL